MHYKALIVEMDPPARAKPVLEKLEQAGRVIRWGENDNEADLLRAIERLVSADVKVSPKNRNVRVRHVIKNGLHCYFLFNEGEDDITAHLHFSVKGQLYMMDVESEQIASINEDTTLHLSAHKIRVIVVSDSPLPKRQ